MPTRKASTTSQGEVPVPEDVQRHDRLGRPRLGEAEPGRGRDREHAEADDLR